MLRQGSSSVTAFLVPRRAEPAIGSMRRGRDVCQPTLRLRLRLDSARSASIVPGAARPKANAVILLHTRQK